MEHKLCRSVSVMVSVAVVQVCLTVYLCCMHMNVQA